MDNLASSGVELPDLSLLKKFDIPAPRYTSYPTADRFRHDITPEDYAEALRGRKSSKNQKALSVYVHIPFCSDVCYYCGCNKIVTRDHSRAKDYLEVLLKEADLVKGFITGSTELEQLHWGGGTPTFLDNDEIESLFSLQAATLRQNVRRSVHRIIVDIDIRRKQRLVAVVKFFEVGCGERASCRHLGERHL